MIAVDTSALVAIILRKPQAAACLAALEAESELVISAVTFAEALIVASRRNFAAEMEQLIAGFGFVIGPVTSAAARRAAAAYRRWGRGIHPAGLNFGDCFAYELARENNCPLLFVGDDFVRTDLPRVI